MLHNFIPHKDELLYSTCARFHISRRYSTQNETLEELFGSKNANAIIALPNRLDILCSNLSEASQYTSDKIISEHTLFPFYRPFLPKNRVDKIIQGMKGNNGWTTHNASGISQSIINQPKFLRFCPECLQADIESVGEVYWHRSHQLIGVEICHIHACPLIDSELGSSAAFNLRNCRYFVDLGEEIKNKKTPSHVKAIPASQLEHNEWLANAIHWLLNHCPTNMSPDELRSRYLYYLKEKNLTSFYGTVKTKELISEFRNFYSDKFLRKLNCDLDLKNYVWLAMVYRKNPSSSHPLRHLLFMRFLGITPEVFFKEPLQENHPFREGPWICLNPACQHYREPVVTDCRVTRDCHLGVPVGTFTCLCGFIYSRRGPDRCDDDFYRIGIVKSYGTVWKNELMRLKDEGQTFKQIGEKLKARPKTISKYYKMMKSNNDNHESSPRPLNYSQKKLSYRSRWEIILSQNPEMDFSELRKIANAEFLWLYRHDRGWLNSHRPARSKKGVRQNRRFVDWQLRDRLFADQIISEAYKVMNLDGKPHRITTKNICKRIGKYCNIMFHLPKLPRTQAALQTVIETTDEFQIRRIKWAADELVKRGQPVASYPIKRTAGLTTSRMSDIVKSAVELEVSKRGIVNNRQSKR